ncbi:MAG: phage/plasmid primase, P4 family [Phycisphaerales bacterium]
MTQDTPNMLDAARDYLARGFMPLPLTPGAKSPFMKDWQHLRLTEHELPQWFGGTNNLGLILGELSGWLVDVDLDCDEAVELAEQFLPSTPAITGRPSRPGSHWWYICEDAKTTKLSDPESKGMVVELRSTGSQTAVGPSVHPDGERYDVLESVPAVIEHGELSSAVEALHREVCRRRGHPIDRQSKPQLRSWRTTNPAGPSPTDDSIPMDVRERRCRAYLDKCPEAVPDAGGHKATLRAACECFRFGLDRPTATNVLDWFNTTKCTAEHWTPKELGHKLDDAEEKVRASGEIGIRLAAGNGRDGRTVEEVARQCTDVGNAARFVRKHGGAFRFSHQQNRWLAWDGTRWRLDQSGAHVRACKDSALAIADEAQGSNDPEAVRKWCKTSQRRDRLTAMTALAQPDLAVVSDDLDSDPWLLNCLNGTLDLRTRTLRQHDPGDLITKLAPVKYDPDAQCPRFESFMDRVFDGDEELISFVQQWHGYCLTADIRHQFLPIYHGEGNNGKSVLLDTISAIMGDYATEAAPDLLTVQKHSQHPTEIADLLGRRMVIASETEEGAMLKIQTLKRLTGNARLKGRFMRGNFFEFGRTHKMVLVTNNRPAITEDSEAVWRRILLVPFNVVIPPHERDPGLMEKLWLERAGILAWMVRGCPEPEDRSLDVPDSIKVATHEYRGRPNSLQEFVDAQCELERRATTTSEDLIRNYEAWCEANDHVPLKARAVGAVLRNLGCTACKPKGVRSWAGIRVREHAIGHKGQNQSESPVCAANE